MRIEEIPVRPKEPKITRVAAYARVSSDKDAAFHSLEAQTEYYQNYIAAHPDWELVAIYSDNGISSKTINEIAAILTSMGVLTPAGRTKWSVSTVRSILSNEKYKGEALLQKTFTVDYLTKEVRKNNGEVPSVRVRNSHEPIIEPEVFDRVQEILAESIKRRAKVRTKHPFAGRLICGDCSSFYGHKVWRLRSTGERYNVWYCNHKYDGDKTCDSPRLRDEEIKAAFEKMLQKYGDSNPVYTDERWNKLVESVKVCRGGHLIFTLKDGRIVKVTLQDH